MQFSDSRCLSGHVEIILTILTMVVRLEIQHSALGFGDKDSFVSQAVKLTIW